MVTQQGITTTALEEPTTEAFKAGVRGPVFLPGDAGYDEARKVYNALIDRRPALIVQCVDIADVISAVNFARDNQLILSVRGGGHNVVGFAVNDGGLVIDLSRMKGIRVDQEQVRPDQPVPDEPEHQAGRVTVRAQAALGGVPRRCLGTPHAAINGDGRAHHVSSAAPSPSKWRSAS